MIRPALATLLLMIHAGANALPSFWSVITGTPTGDTLKLLRPLQPLSLSEARKMTPQELGDALLEQGHARVDAASVGRQDFRPPLRAGMMESTPIVLYLAGRPSAQPGFCERTIATIQLQPVKVQPGGVLPPAAAEKIDTVIGFQWTNGMSCGAGRTDYFVPENGSVFRALASVRQLAAAVSLARGRERLPFDLAFEDPHGLSVTSNANSVVASENRTEPEDRTALASLPLDHVWGVAASGPRTLNPMTTTELSKIGSDATGYNLFMGPYWNVGLVLDGDRIVSIQIVCRPPAPF